MEHRNIQAVKGMNDILPEQILLWQRVEKTLMQLLARYGYNEIRLPIVEKTELFKRTIGEATDIVEKEMYTFLDRNEESLTLRPEGTAGCVRAAIEHGLTYNQIQKLWYMGSMFRYERPQKGRYRQFYQLGVEVFGLSGVAIETELLLLTYRLWRELALTKEIHLEINCLGTPDARKNYRQAFVAYCEKHIDQLDEDSKRRLTTNPLRILDSKNPALKELLMHGPKLADYWDAESAAQFKSLCQLLDHHQITYRVNPRLVRGLDYYTGVVFEWVTEALGAQGAVCAGGRYDGLVEQLGGAPTPAIGFAMGIERIVALLELQNKTEISAIDAYVIAVGEGSERSSLQLAEKLRDVLPSLRVEVNLSGGNFKSQFKKADKSGAHYALILGEDEINKAVVTCKNLRKDEGQVTLAFPELVTHLRSHA